MTRDTRNEAVELYTKEPQLPDCYAVVEAGPAEMVPDTAAPLKGLYEEMKHRGARV